MMNEALLGIDRGCREQGMWVQESNVNAFSAELQWKFWKRSNYVL